MRVQTYCFDRDVLYREVSVQHPVIEAYFEFYNPDNKSIIVIPDGASDFLFIYNDHESSVYLGGTALKGRTRLVPINGRAFGVRIRPGIVFDCFRHSLTGFVDSALCLNDVAPFGELAKRMPLTGDFAERIRLFNEVLPLWAKVRLHPITKFLLSSLRQDSRELSLDRLIARTGYSHVHVNRVFKAETGLSLKFFLDTLRMQRAIYCLRHEEAPNLQALAEELGFYDQAHFSKKFKYYTCYSPKKFYEKFKLSLT
jgi:AraC-like DNA-binding protein